jgi:cytochrome c oxidase subunit II
MQDRTRRIVIRSVLGLLFLILLVIVNGLMLRPLPEAVSTFAHEIDTVFYVIYYITGFVFALVTVLLVWFLIEYRAQPGRRAVYTHGSSVLELTWTIVPVMVFITIFLISQSTWARVKIFAPPGEVEVRVTAKQFAWEVLYPGPDGKFDTGDDKTLQGELHVPVDKVVRVYLRSKDVIHSFFVPTMRLKQDAVPGREITAWFQAIKAGRYEWPCAELCGPGHSGMRGWVTVHSPEAYQEWVKQQWPSS